MTFSHIDKNNKPQMVNVGEKEVTHRTATARAKLILPPEIQAALVDGDIQSKKGPVFQTAILAGIMAAKKTSDLIPLCHPLPLEDCHIDIQPDSESTLLIECRCETHHKTGVEMEALTAVSVAALTVYDMCKALSHDIVITELGLVEKTGGKRDK